MCSFAGNHGQSQLSVNALETHSKDWNSYKSNRAGVAVVNDKVFNDKNACQLVIVKSYLRRRRYLHHKGKVKYPSTVMANRERSITFTRNSLTNT